MGKTGDKRCETGCAERKVSSLGNVPYKERWHSIICLSVWP